MLDATTRRRHGRAKDVLDLGRPLSSRISGALFLATLGTLLWLERRRPLRRRTEPGARRDVRNAAVAALSAAAISRLEKPLVQRLARLVHERRWGLVKLVALPAWLEVSLSVVLLDYTLWVWHVLTHRSDFLWRFHRVHHADRDLSATTALRFHFAEMILSVPWRAAQVLVVGASPLSLTTWQTATLLAILFHHSDVELPYALERRLCRLVTTPRVHGIHHSIVRGEADANWATIFTLPDFLHGTARFSVPQDEVTIGIGSPSEPRELTLGKLLVMPLRPEVRDREALPVPPRARGDVRRLAA